MMSERNKNIAIAFMGLVVVCCFLGTYFMEQKSKSARENASSNQTNIHSDTNTNSSNTNSSSENSNSSTNEVSNTNSNPTEESNTNSNEPTNSNTNPTTSTNIVSSTNITSNTNSSNKPSTNTNSNKPSVGTSTNVTPVSKVLASGTANGKSIKVENRCGEYTTQQIDEYYKDNQYIYYFNFGMSSCIHVIVNNKDYTIRNVLNQKVVTPAELEKIGYHLMKKANNTVTK